MILNDDASFYVAANLAFRKVIEGNKHDIETRKHSSFLVAGLGVDGGWMPLPTRPQQYCDPVSLVVIKQLYSTPTLKASI